MYKIRNAIQNRCYPNWPKSATMEEWAKVHKSAKKRKLCYWLSNTMPTWISVKGMQLHDVKMWFKYRLQTRHHYHLIDTGLGYGYHEIENRMLHGNFNMLKNYVESELAHINDLGNSDAPKQGREAGLQQLAWQQSLTHDEDECKAYGSPELAGKRTEQALNADKIVELYLWWVDTRPSRIDPWDAEYERRTKGKEEVKTDLYEMLGTKETPEEKEARNKFWDKKQAIEDQYMKEDDEMLIELIKIRRTLWT